MVNISIKYPNMPLTWRDDALITSLYLFSWISQTMSPTVIVLLVAASFRLARRVFAGWRRALHGVTDIHQRASGSDFKQAAVVCPIV